MAANRLDQKTTLDTILSSITYGDSNLAVETSYINTPQQYPYFYILSGGGRTEWYSNQTRKVFRTYYVNVVFKLSDDKEVPTNEIDDIEGLILSKLFEASTIYGNQPTWNDLWVRDWSNPLQDDVAIRDNVIYKTFTVECESYEQVN